MVLIGGRIGLEGVGYFTRVDIIGCSARLDLLIRGLLATTEWFPHPRKIYTCSQWCGIIGLEPSYFVAPDVAYQCIPSPGDFMLQHIILAGWHDTQCIICTTIRGLDVIKFWDIRHWWHCIFTSESRFKITSHTSYDLGCVGGWVRGTSLS